MSSNVCDLINTVDKYVVDDPNNPGEYDSSHLLKVAFSDNNCGSDDQKLSSSFIALLTLLNDKNKNENLEGDKLVEYAILWLSYKLNQKKENRMTIFNELYTQDIETNNCYKQKINANSNSDNKISKDVIKKKIESMDIDIKDISNFYDAFKSLCNMYNEIVADDDQCNKCLESAGELFEKYEKLKNDLNINKGSSYYQLLSSLSNDYKIFENKYSDKCNHGSPLVACPRNSVIKNTLITIAIIFVAASILLGVSYKYSLFGFRKRGQKQHLREKLKK